MPAAVLVHKPPVPRPRTRPALPVGVRAKLKLGGAHDEAEKQADRVAAQALARPAPTPVAGDPRPAIRRAVAPPDESKRPPPEIEDEQALPETVEREIAALQAGGEPLPPPLRTDMEARLGMDLGAVRVHTGADAVRLNEVLHAHAFAVGEHIAFNAGRFRPDTGPGRFLLAHELVHVAQQRGQAAGAARQPVRRGFWSRLYHGVADTLGDIANWALDKVAEYGWRLLESIAPEFARTVRAIKEEGILAWLGRQVARAWDGFIAGLRALVPFEGPRQLIDLFAGLVQRAARIVAALASGNCEPLMRAIADLKTFVVDTVGVAWDKLTEFLRPVGQFFSDLWRNFGAPAVQWLRDFGGAVWQGIQDLGRRLWEWIRPVREAAARIWNWFKDKLFGSEDGEANGASQGGVIGWISRKAGEAWDWVKARTRPVWQPVAEFAGRVAELIPPAFVREMGQHAQQLSSELNSASEGMNGGEGVPQSRDTLASVLPSVQAVIATVRRIIVGAGQWLGQRIAGVGTLVSGLVGRLRANALLSWLAGAFTWLEEAVGRLVTWARDGVAALFNWLVQGFDALTPFLHTVLETVRKLITVFGDLLQLPLLVLNSIWQRVPACIRDPIENFIKNQILARIPVFGQFFSDPTLWPRVQQTALGILRRIFVDGDLAGAAWAFFQAVLGILGVPAQLVVQILAKAAGAIGAILSNPIGFLVNLLRAMGAGFTGFFGNIGRHLLTGFTGWLFSTVREAGINPPADFSLRSVLGFVMEVLGVTVDNIFARLRRRLDPAIVARLQQMLTIATGVWSFVATLINDGPAGLWRELSERLANLWNTVVSGVIGYITERVIGWASRWLLSLLDVSGIMPVINTLIAIYRAIQSFIAYLRQILEIVNRVLDGIVGIARGAIGEAAGFVEGALAASLPIAIGFLANQAGLGRLSQRLREILGGLRERVNGAIDWLIERALRLGRAVIDMVRRAGAAVRGAVGRVREWWRARRSFRVGNQSHSLYIRGNDRSARLMIASTPQTYAEFIGAVTVAPDKQADKDTALTLAGQIDTAIQEAAAAPAGSAAAPPAGAPAGTSHAGAPQAAQATRIDTLLADLATVTARFMPLGGAQPATPPVWGPKTARGWGTFVRVPRLTADRAAWGFSGGSPSVGGGHWDRLNERRSASGRSSYYVRGHLLNHNIGGPGDDWKNLTPLTQGANNRDSDSMLRTFETPVKNAVAAGRTVLNFVVTANYGSNDRSTDMAALEQDAVAAETAGNAAEAGRLRRVKGVVDEEQTIPTSISLSAQVLKDDGSVDSNVNPAPVNNQPERTLSSYRVRP
ncbi:DUF4157 domain-containing protein [Parasulfuritortus cantonensis]|uniref:DUF4157 domain-containing protein n=1 Tax=Parasulfuritortus cantonensis TaxID=2528202 RepID=A0A4R1B777_9PROT|nr:DUF4157 domain-containing protein [Parasulfuritortus cantonensis]TCJ12328.1 DUF4157 domain-containing protein [Parasulfuritortus cantonensis]